MDKLPDEAKTVIRKTLAEIMGLADGYCGGRGGSMHLRDKQAGFFGSNAIVAGGIPLATGTAFTEKYNNTGNIVVCFFGDGAINQGAFHEACNLAGLWKLPIIFFLENNEYAVATKVDNSCAVSELSVRAASYGMDAHVVDGNDAFAIYHLMSSLLRISERTTDLVLLKLNAIDDFIMQEISRAALSNTGQKKKKISG